MTGNQDEIVVERYKSLNPMEKPDCPVWTVHGGGSFQDYIGTRSLAFDSEGYLNLAGYFHGELTFDPDGPIENTLLSAGNDSDVFVVRLKQ